MDKTISLPSYSDAQKIRLTEWLHKAFFDGWTLNVSLTELFAEFIELLRQIEENHRESEKSRHGVCTPEWFTWNGKAEDFLDHLYYAGVPGCVPFDCGQTVRRYVEISFGEDALEYLDGRVAKKDFQSFTHYLAACGFYTKRLKKFTMPLHLELLAAAALKLPPPVPTPAPTSPPMKTDPRSPQGKLF
jgi:hypothetical protein